MMVIFHLDVTLVDARRQAVLCDSNIKLNDPRSLRCAEGSVMPEPIRA